VYFKTEHTVTPSIFVWWFIIWIAFGGTLYD